MQVAETMNIGAWMKEVRKKKRITLREAAEAVGCSQSYIHRLENNSRKNPSAHLVKQLAEFYEVDVSDLLGASSKEAGERLSSREDAKQECQIAENNLAEAVSLLRRIETGTTSDDALNDVRRKIIDAQKSLMYMRMLL